jgi:very-short-patch-repair endonuclease
MKMIDMDVLERLVRSHAGALLMERAANAGYMASARAIGEASRVCESPIEVLMMGAIISHLRIEGCPVSVLDPGLKIILPLNIKGTAGWVVSPQAKIVDYRVDMLVGYRDRQGRQGFVAVECDGHDFHERTKEQAIRDKTRDRFLQEHFGAVLHFTGSEIHRDAWGCAGEVIRHVERVREASPPRPIGEAAE